MSTVLLLSAPLSSQENLDVGLVLSGRSYGFSLETESHGTALGLFYSSTLSENAQIFGQVKLLDITGDAELPVYDPYTGVTYKASAVNLVLMPFFAGMKFHPFIGELANNFSPFLMVTAGPVGILNLPEDKSFFQQWKEVDTGIYAGAFVGFGADFMVQSTRYVTFVIGYDFLPMGKDIDGREDYSGTVLKVMLGKNVK